MKMTNWNKNFLNFNKSLISLKGAQPGEEMVVTKVVVNVFKLKKWRCLPRRCLLRLWQYKKWRFRRHLSKKRMSLWLLSTWTQLLRERESHPDSQKRVSTCQRRPAEHQNSKSQKGCHLTKPRWKLKNMRSFNSNNLLIKFKLVILMLNKKSSEARSCPGAEVQPRRLGAEWMARTTWEMIMMAIMSRFFPKGTCCRRKSSSLRSRRKGKACSREAEALKSLSSL
jgi:hypothetical protein